MDNINIILIILVISTFYLLLQIGQPDISKFPLTQQMIPRQKKNVSKFDQISIAKPIRVWRQGPMNKGPIRDRIRIKRPHRGERRPRRDMVYF